MKKYFARFTCMTLGVLILAQVLSLPLEAQIPPPDKEIEQRCTVYVSKKASFWQKMGYWLSKITEAGLLFDKHAMRMAKYGVRAHQERTNKHMREVRFDQIRFYHPIDTPQAKGKTAERVKMLNAKKKELLADKGTLRPKIYEKIIPSIDPIQLVIMEKDSQGRALNYLIIQGQGRIKAMKEVFPPDTLLEVEVSEIPEQTLSKLVKIRKKFQLRGKLSALD